MSSSIDKLEQLIKTNFLVGDIFKSKADLFDKIGLQNLGVQSLQGGKQKNKAYEIICQYMKLEFVEDGKRALICKEIYETPKYMIKEENRGSRGVYIDRTVSILINLLLHEDVYVTTVNDLATAIGLIPKNILFEINKEELQKINSKISRKMYNQFYYDRCKPRAEDIIMTTLKRLSEKYKVISFDKTYEITKENNEKIIADRVEAEIIREVENEILPMFDFKNMLQMMKSSKSGKFYRQVVDTINNEYDFEWQEYRKIIKIVVEEKKIKEIAEKLSISNDDIQQKKKEISLYLKAYLVKKTENDYIKTNTIAEEVEDNWRENLKEINIEDYIVDEEIKKLYQLGLANRDDMIKWYISEPEPFKYHEDYLEIQKDIIDFFFGKEDVNIDINMEWLGLVE